MRQIFLDTETTGLYPTKGDRMIEIGCVEMINRKLTGNDKHFYVNPGRDSHEEALKIHGISNEFLRDKPKFVEVADELWAYLQGAEVIIHNAPFDVSFLNNELKLMGKGLLHECATKITDSLALAKELFPGKRNSLDALCDRLGVDNSNRTLHGALLDAQLLANVYISLTRGQNSLVIDASSPSAAEKVANKHDLQGIELPVILADEADLAAHASVLNEIDKASRGKTVWRASVLAA